MRIAAITNSRIPSLTANSIQAMKVCDALTGIGNELTLIAPAEAPAATWPELAKHYGLTHRFDVQWRPSLRALKRLDFVWYAHSAAQRFKPDLIYTWLPQSAAFALWRGYPTVLEMHADVAGRFGAWWLRRFWSARGRKRLLVTTQALQTALERSTSPSFPDAAARIEVAREPRSRAIGQIQIPPRLRSLRQIRVTLAVNSVWCDLYRRIRKG